MYLTAQHVVAPDRSGEGINAFAHLHGDRSRISPQDEAGIRLVADDDPGALIDQDVDLRPGGNSVRSYLDVVAADGESSAKIRAGLDALEMELGRSDPPIARVVDGIGLRLNMNIGLYPQKLVEFSRLRDRIERLFEKCERDGWKVNPAVL